MHQIVLFLLSQLVAGQLLCPRSPPASIYRIPEIDPCRSEAIRTDALEMKTPNTEAYITNATLVYMDKCTAEGTYYFFGVKTCQKACTMVKLTDYDAKALLAGFCPVNSAHHVRFDSQFGVHPRCKYNWPQSTITSSIMCYRVNGYISYTHLEHPFSNLASMTGCIYEDGVCMLSNGHWIFWDVDERSKADYIVSNTTYAVCDGHRVWIPEMNIGFGLKTPGCFWEGFAQTYEGVSLRWKSPSIGPRSRVKRSNPSKETLSLLEYIMGESNLAASSFCQTMLGVVPASNIIPHSSPTLYARMLLNNSNVIARSHQSHLFVWYCARVDAHPRDGDCYQYPRVKYIFNNVTYNGFMMDDGQIINSTIQHQCSDHLLVYSLNNRAYVEMGSTTTEHQSSVLDSHHHNSLAALHPNFSSVYHNTDVWSDIIKKISVTLAQVVNHARELGGMIDGEGGGTGVVNFPGLKHGWLANVVASFQTFVTTAIVIYVLYKLVKQRGRRTPINRPILLN